MKQRLVKISMSLNDRIFRHEEHIPVPKELEFFFFKIFPDKGLEKLIHSSEAISK